MRHVTPVSLSLGPSCITLHTIRFQVRFTEQASADVVSVVFTRMCPRLWLLRATSRQQAKMIPEFLRLPSLGC